MNKTTKHNNTVPGKKKEREEKVRQTKEKLEKEKLRKMQSMKEAMARSEALKRLRDEEKRKRCIFLFFFIFHKAHQQTVCRLCGLNL